MYYQRFRVNIVNATDDAFVTMITLSYATTPKSDIVFTLLCCDVQLQLSAYISRLLNYQNSVATLGLPILGC